MHEIICPHCKKEFKIDEAGYAEILKQVRDTEFEQQLHERLETASQLAEARRLNELQKAAATKDAEIQGLKARLDGSEVAQKLAISEAVNAVEKERDKLKSDLAQAQLEKELGEKLLKDKYETQIKDRDNAIERLRDMKARLSTKMVGETLEQHCETEFNRIRATGFPRSYFEKDNDARAGSKETTSFATGMRLARRSSRSCSR